MKQYSSKILFILTFCLAFGISASFASGNDLNTYNSFFPMQIGNKWIFQRNEDPPYNTFVTFKIEDTTCVDGNRYYKILPTLFDFGNYYRVDSLGNFLQLDNEKAILNFNMNVGDSIQIAYSAEYSDSGYTYCIYR